MRFLWLVLFCASLAVPALACEDGPYEPPTSIEAGIVGNTDKVFVGVVKRTGESDVTFEVLKGVKDAKANDLVTVPWFQTDCQWQPQPLEVWFYARQVRSQEMQAHEERNPHLKGALEFARNRGIMLRDQCGSVTEPAATQVRSDFGYDIANAKPIPKRDPDSCLRPGTWPYIRAMAKKGDAEAELGQGFLFFHDAYAHHDEAGFVKAAGWWRKAADQGNTEAQRWLSGMYERGQGVAKDYAEAYFWFLLAAKAQDERLAHLRGNTSPSTTPDELDAQMYQEQNAKRLSEIEQQLNAEQISAAKKRVQEWKPASGHGADQ